MKEWEEKEKDKPTGNIRIYIGKLHVGTCRRKSKLEEMYSFYSLYDEVTRSMDTVRWQPLEDIKFNLELCWKEHATKFLKSLRTLNKVTN